MVIHAQDFLNQETEEESATSKEVEEGSIFNHTVDDEEEEEQKQIQRVRKGYSICQNTS